MLPAPVGTAAFDGLRSSIAPSVIPTRQITPCTRKNSVIPRLPMYPSAPTTGSLKIYAPKPNPATAIPTTSPLALGNHLTNAAIGQT